jgi:hypothetical protein
MCATMIPATAPTAGGEAPAQRQHPVDPDADQPRHLRVLRRRPHREPSGVKRKNTNSRVSTIRVTSTTPSWCGPITPAMPKLDFGKGDGNSLIR